MTLWRSIVPAAAGSLALLFLCAGPAHNVMPGYEKLQPGGTTLGILLVKKNIVISNPLELTDVLGGSDAVESYYQFFAREFPSLFTGRSKFANAEFLLEADGNMRVRSDRPVGIGDGNTVTLPAGRYFVDRKYGFLLIIDLCAIQRDLHGGASMIGAEGGFTGFTGGLDYTRQSLSFVVWDNTRATIAAYGTVKEAQPTGGTLTRQVLVDLLANIATSINRGMPYRK